MGNGLEPFLISIARIADVVISRLANPRGIGRYNLKAVWWSTDQMVLTLESLGEPLAVQASLSFTTDVYAYRVY